MHLRCIKDIEPFAQELAWPVFVAGMECCGRLDEQAVVEDRMEEIMRINGPLDRRRMMEFLRGWWRIEEEERSRRSWIDLAREKARDGDSFLLF